MVKVLLAGVGSFWRRRVAHREALLLNGGVILLFKKELVLTLSSGDLDLLLSDLFTEPVGSRGVVGGCLGALNHLLAHLDVDLVNFSLHLSLLIFFIFKVSVKLIDLVLQSPLLLVEIADFLT